MKAKIIKTKTEYEAALARIDKLMDAAPNTPQGDQLALLSLLVRDYEEKKFPIAKPDPVAAIRFRDGTTGARTERPGPVVGQPESRIGSALRQTWPQPQDDSRSGNWLA